MVVQCDQCNAKFRLDDSKVTENGVKVRCSKCKNIFLVRKAVPTEEADFDSLLSGLGAKSPEPAIMTEEPVLSAETPSVTEPPETAVTGFFAETKEEAGVEAPEKEEPDFIEYASDSSQESSPARPSHQETEDFKLKDIAGEEFYLEENQANKYDETEKEAATEKTESAFEENFFLLPDEQNQSQYQNENDDTEKAGIPDDFTEPLDFGVEEEEEISFDVKEAEDDSVFQVQDMGTERDDGLPAPFDFEEYEVEENVAAGIKEHGDEAAREPDLSHLEEPAAPAGPDVYSGPLVQGYGVEAEEFSPTSTRRKGSSIFPILVTAISVIILLVLVGGGFYLFQEGPAGFDKLGLGFMSSWFGVEAKEEGKIIVKSASGAFINNKEVGEIFVVTGEVVNNFAKPRASNQVKVILYGQKGENLQSKTAYCGNLLSTEQLTTLPLAKIEAAMANQFGDSLSNLAVQPGKGISYVVVFTNVAKEVAEFGVESAGSTVASQ